MKSKKFDIQTAGIDELVMLKHRLEFSIGLVNASELTSQRFEELKVLKSQADIRVKDIHEERRRLRQDPKNRTSIFSSLFQGTRWTAECEKQCALLDKEQEKIQKSIDLSKFERDLHCYELDKQKLKLVNNRLAQLRDAKERTEKLMQEKEALKIRAKRNEDEIRSIGISVKRRLQTYEVCPYCGNGIGTEIHADHIFPVSKGGLSIESNMVIVCGDCNLKKSNLTLAMFIKKYRLDRDEIEARLTDQKKDF